MCSGPYPPRATNRTLLWVPAAWWTRNVPNSTAMIWPRLLTTCGVGCPGGEKPARAQVGSAVVVTVPAHADGPAGGLACWPLLVHTASAVAAPAVPRMLA